MGEVEKNSFIAFPGKGGHSGLTPSKLCPNLGCEESYSQGAGVADKDQGACRACVPSIQRSSGIRWFCDGLLWFLRLLNCDLLSGMKRASSNS